MESYYKRGDGFVSTTTFDDAGVLSSDYIKQSFLNPAQFPIIIKTMNTKQ